jgi:hypothetical protein
MDLRAKFIQLLTSDDEHGFHVFNTDGTPAWCEIRLDMILDKFDKAMEE